MIQQSRLLISFIFLISFGCFEGSAGTDIEAKVLRIKNSDIQWTAGFSGVAPEVRGDASKEVLASGVAATPFLIRLLSEKDQYQAAHVLLSTLYQATLRDESNVQDIKKAWDRAPHFKANPRAHADPDWSDWNGMRIKFYAHREPVFDIEDRLYLKEQWSEWVAEQQRDK